jgi:two-component system sensor histidine kinase VicK
MIDGVVKELEMKSGVKADLKIIWSQNPGLPKTIYDEEKIRHVVYNFVDNAIKYSDKGEIKVDVARDGDGVAVRVRDSGIGFDKVDEVNFFQKFYRGNNVLGMNVTGTGLGLYVCAKFIEAHHGRVWCKSTGIGKGSEFGFWIPTHQA